MANDTASAIDRATPDLRANGGKAHRRRLLDRIFNGVKVRGLTAATVVWGRAKYGLPNILLAHPGGPGDALLCSAVLHELKLRQTPGVWAMVQYPQLLQDAGAEVLLPPWQYYWNAFTWLGSKVIDLDYAPHDPLTDRDGPPKLHLIAVMCALAGIKGKISLRPYLQLSAAEREKGRLVERQIVIQSAGLGSGVPMQNKQWFPERFAEVVNAFRGRYNFVQLGSAADPPLPGVLNLCGKTSLRHSAAILANSQAFVGNVGFLMHLARAVECRSVIVYGGREAPWQSGYRCNENIFNAVPCAPCWLRNACPYDRKCMDQILAPTVISALELQLAKFGEPLAVDDDEI